MIVPSKRSGGLRHTSQLPQSWSIVSHKQQFGVEPAVKVIHAGLECGIIGAIIPGLDMISFGPTLRSPHSPDERALIPTVRKFYDFLVATLEQTPLK